MFHTRSRVEITVLVTESFVDGQAGGGAGIFDIPDGASLSDSFFVSPDVREGSHSLYQNAQSGSLTLRVIDANSYSTLFDIPITFVRQGSVFIPSVGSSQSLPSTVAPEPTPNYQFHRELSNGDEGNDVVYLQTRLYLMRYYDGEIDGIFGNQTAQAVYAFKMANGIYDSDSEKYVATFEMLECLNSGSAIYYSEPEFALVLEGYGQWEFPGNDRIRMRVKVTNTAKSKTVKAFEMYMYAVDVWGDPIYGEDMVYYGTTEKTVSPVRPSIPITSPCPIKARWIRSMPESTRSSIPTAQSRRPLPSITTIGKSIKPFPSETNRPYTRSRVPKTLSQGAL